VRVYGLRITSDMSVRRVVRLLLALLFVTTSLSARDSTITPNIDLAVSRYAVPENDYFHRVEISSGRRLASQIMIGTVVAGSLIESYYAWWKDATGPFTFYDEQWFKNHRGIDKPGHFFGAYFFFHMSREIMLYGGHSEATANWWGIGLSFFHSISIEIGDGFSPYGFSYQDLLFDLGGLGYGYLQTQVPYLNNFNFKFSYWSSQVRSPANFTRDYDAMTIWLAFNVHGLLPDSWKKYWPEFLQVAVGYSVDDNQSRSELALAFDINLGVFSIGNKELSLLRNIANYKHWPAPGVKFTEGKKPTYRLFLMR
jgi:hypothetical protein